MLKKFFRFCIVFFVILGISFSNIPAHTLSIAINSYLDARNIVDVAWNAQKDGKVVDKFVSLRSLPEKLKIHEARAATTFINVAHYNSASSASATVSKPTNTAQNDIMFAVIMRTSSTAPTTVPSGWVSAGTHSYTTIYRQDLYYKIAGASEGASYTWAWAAAAKVAITIATYRGGFDTSSPIDVVSNTAYIVSNANVQAASMNVTAANSVLLNFATFYSTAVKTFTKPSVPTTDWVENYDGGATTSDFSRTIDSMTWTGSGATGVMNTTASAIGTTVKHAFAVALKPLAANSPPTLSLSQPDGIGDTITSGSSYNITYSLADTDNVVTTAFYYDTDNTGLNGTAITGACAAAVEGSGATCSWNTTGYPAGTYYIYGIANDGVNPQVSAYSSGQITIQSTGSLAVDMVDSGGVPVASPTISFASKNFSWLAQQATGTLGIASAKIRVNNTTGTAAWTLSLAATGGNTSLWNSGGNNYDYNGSSAAGRLRIDPSASTITPQGGCATTGLSKGAATYFVQGTQDSINLITASGSTQTNCYWDITGINLTQDIPASQVTGSYSIGMTLTAI